MKMEWKQFLRNLYVILRKLVHGHIMSLDKQRDVEFIFYPCIPYERKEVEGCRQSF